MSRQYLHPEDFPYENAVLARANVMHHPGRIMVLTNDAYTLVPYSLTRVYLVRLSQRAREDMIDDIPINLKMARSELPYENDPELNYFSLLSHALGVQIRDPEKEIQALEELLHILER